MSQGTVTAQMKTLAWNCRGLGGASTIRYLTSLQVEATTPDLIFLAETKCNQKQVNSIVPIARLCHHYSVPAQGSSSGLSLIWTDEIKINIIAATTYCIAAIIQSDSSRPWLFVGVYIHSDIA